MKNFLFAAVILLSFSCKKEKASENITAYHWVLKAQVASPAVTIDGKTSTDYLSLQNPEGCSKNFGFTFYANGTFAKGSNGALCDMIANSDRQKWTREGDQITLDYGNGPSTLKLTIKGNTLIGTSSITMNGSTHTIVSTYRAEKN